MKVKKEFVRREFGEMLESPKKDKNDPNEKARYYIKITAKNDILKYLESGSIIEFEEPQVKYRRMIESGKLDEKAIADVQEKMSKIPTFLKRRLLLKIPKEQFKG